MILQKYNEEFSAIDQQIPTRMALHAGAEKR